MDLRDLLWLIFHIYIMGTVWTYTGALFRTLLQHSQPGL